MTEAEACAELIQKALPKVKAGTLRVWSPTGLTVDESTFRITGAKRVRWACGITAAAPRVSALKFVSSERGVTVITNTGWYKPKFNPKRTEPAVALL